MAEGEPQEPQAEAPRTSDKERKGWSLNALGWGAIAAVISAALALSANISELAGLFATDETREIVEQTQVVARDTDEKVEELLVLLRNQAAATGLDLDIGSESAIRNAVQAIVASSNAQKQMALEHLNNGDVGKAADVMAEVASIQAGAVSETSDAAAESWREAGALFFTLDIPRAVEAYREANRLQPNHFPTLDMLGSALLRAGELDESQQVFREALPIASLPTEVGMAHLGLGALARMRGDYGAADAHYGAALTATANEQTSITHTRALILSGLLDMARGDNDAAVEKLDSALLFAEAAGSIRARGEVLSALGTLAARQQRFDDAERIMQEALTIYEDQDDLAGQVNLLGNLGAVSLSRGDLESAQSLIGKSAELSEQLGWQSSLAYDLINLAGIATQNSDYDLAYQNLDRAESIVTEVGLTEILPIIIFNRGETARDSGDMNSACANWQKALPMLVEMGSVHAEYAEGQIERAECEKDL